MNIQKSDEICFRNNVCKSDFLKMYIWNLFFSLQISCFFLLTKYFTRMSRKKNQIFKSINALEKGEMFVTKWFINTKQSRTRTRRIYERNEPANQPISQAIKADRQTFRLHAFRSLLSYFTNGAFFTFIPPERRKFGAFWFANDF